VPQNDDHLDDAPTGPIPIIDGPAERSGSGVMPAPTPDPALPSIARERLELPRTPRTRRRSADSLSHPVRTGAAVLAACLIVLFGVLVAVLLS